MVFSVICYWLCNFWPTATGFFTFVGFLYLDLIAAESLVVFVASILPNFIVALAVVAFANGLWMCVNGFMVPLTILNPFWRTWVTKIDYQAWTFQAMMWNGERLAVVAQGDDVAADPLDPRIPRSRLLLRRSRQLHVPARTGRYHHSWSIDSRVLWLSRWSPRRVCWIHHRHHLRLSPGRVHRTNIAKAGLGEKEAGPRPEFRVL